jgi:hypothetical protein
LLLLAKFFLFCCVSQWFADLLAELQAAEDEEKAADPTYPGLLDIRMYLTSVQKGKDDLAAMLFHVGVESSAEAYGEDIVSRLRNVTRFGRPDFDQLFSEVKEKHPGQDVGVFFCGPVQLGASLGWFDFLPLLVLTVCSSSVECGGTETACMRHSKNGEGKFIFKQEVF